jgi:hypothetical protein
MGPEQQDLAARLRAFLARVRWENIALLGLVALAAAGVVMSGALSGSGGRPLPADIGVRGHSPPPAGSLRPQPHPQPRETRGRTKTTQGKRRTRKHRRVRHQAAPRDPHPLGKTTPLPPPSPPPAGAGGEFAPG